MYRIHPFGCVFAENMIVPLDPNWRNNTCEWMDGWMDGQTDKRTDGRTDGWMLKPHSSIQLSSPAHLLMLYYVKLHIKLKGTHHSIVKKEEFQNPR